MIRRAVFVTTEAPVDGRHPRSGDRFLYETAHSALDVVYHYLGRTYDE